MKLKTTHRFDIGRNIGYSHSATVKLGDKEGMLFLTTPGVGVDPGEELFHYKGIENTWLVMFDMDGNKLWERELPDGVLPGIHQAETMLHLLNLLKSLLGLQENPEEL